MDRQKTKKMAVMAMLAALSFIVMAVGRIPIVLFLKYDPKDVVIAIGGFIFGPLSAFLISVVVSFVEMLTLSDTGPIGLVMNILSTCSFACTAAFIYKRKHTLKGAVVGLLTGFVAMTAVMIIWNYFIAPLYMGISREAVKELLIPAFLPFNLFKGVLNSALTLLIYKPLVKALRKSGLVPESKAVAGKGYNFGLVMASALALLTCAVFVLVVKGVI